MSINDIYTSYLYNQYVLSKIKTDTSPTFTEIEQFYRNSIEGLDLSVPQFNSDTYAVSENENSSATKINNTHVAIKQDLTVLYKAFAALMQTTVEDFERWRYEIRSLEKRLIDLEGRIENLLLLAQDTEGYHSFFFDNFSDLYNVDLNNTDVAVDIASQLIYLSPTLSSLQTTTWVPLDIEEDDISFNVRTTINYISRQSPPGEVHTKLEIFDNDDNTSWITNVFMRTDKPVTCELIVKLGEDAIDISSIYVGLHQSNFSGPISITPLYSIDGYNYTQLPTAAYTLESKTNVTFNFTTISTKYLKFILVKEKPDDIRDLVGDTAYLYEFGFNEIELYKEAFTIGESKSFISSPISILDKNGDVREFSKVSLEVCESVPEDTEIRYFVAASNSSAFAIDANTKWYPIASLEKTDSIHPRIVNLGDLSETNIGDTETVTISYNGTASNSNYKNPAQNFQLLSLDTDGSILDESIAATAIRYVFSNKNERILNYQIKDSDYTGSGTGTAITMDEDNLSVFRNIGEKGLTAADSIRGVQRGWRFEDPHYITIVEITNPLGMSIDFGNEEVIIDGTSYTNEVDLSGKTSTSNGLHEIKIHKTNWKHVTPELITLAGASGLVAADPLYPYNHKLLVEGYNYGDAWQFSDERIYTGVDLFFERRMRKISLFDFVNDLGESNKYQYFALDRDVGTSHTGGNSSTRIIVVKVDETTTDFINEQFALRFNLINQRYSYLRFRADFLTNTTDDSPVLDSYKIKFGD
jgi:hypothetical protein